jgi:hypothetical protein
MMKLNVVAIHSMFERLEIQAYELINSGQQVV